MNEVSNSRILLDNILNLDLFMIIIRILLNFVKTRINSIFNEESVVYGKAMFFIK